MQEVMPTRNTSHDRGPTWLPPGFRFHPTDEELIVFYLAKKVENPTFTDRAISEVDLNKCEPWDLPGRAKMGEKEWYFFSLRDRKYPTGIRTNRATEAGYWKATGKDREVMSSQDRRLVGMKKTLVFYKGRAPRGEKTNWVMHEYRLEGDHMFHQLTRLSKDDWVVCRIFHKSLGEKKTHFEFRRPVIANDNVSSSLLPPLLESSCLPHEESLQEQRIRSPPQIFTNSTTYHQALRAVRRMGEDLRQSAFGNEASHNSVGYSKGSPYNFYSTDQTAYCRVPVTSDSTSLNISRLQSVAQYASGISMANASSARPSCSSFFNMPSDALLEALVEQYADAKPLYGQTEPYARLTAEEPIKVNARLSENSVLSLGHANDSAETNQPTQHGSQSDLRESGNAFQRQAPLSELSAGTSPGTIGGLTRCPSDQSSGLDIENLWAY